MTQLSSFIVSNNMQARVALYLYFVTFVCILSCLGVRKQTNSRESQTDNTSCGRLLYSVCNTRTKYKDSEGGRGDGWVKKSNSSFKCFLFSTIAEYMEGMSETSSSQAKYGNLQRQYRNRCDVCYNQFSNLKGMNDDTFGPFGDAGAQRIDTRWIRKGISSNNMPENSRETFMVR